MTKALSFAEGCLWEIFIPSLNHTFPIITIAIKKLLTLIGLVGWLVSPERPVSVSTKYKTVGAIRWGRRSGSVWGLTFGVVHQW